MKKMVLPLLAVILAIGFSAFTPETKKGGELWYKVDGDWIPFTGNDCDLPGDDNCIVYIPAEEGFFQIYFDQRDDALVKYDATPGK